MKILMTGSTGLIGTALVTALAGDGQTVCRLIRAESAMAGQAPFAEILGKAEGFDVAWNPATEELGGAGVGADAVVNLAGASVAGGRWTKGRKELLRTSRRSEERRVGNECGSRWWVDSDKNSSSRKE